MLISGFYLSTFVTLEGYIVPILSHELLNPVTYNIKNPFASVVERIESWLTINQPTYLSTQWPFVKREFLKRILKLSKNGLLLRNCSINAPSDDLSVEILSIYNMIDHCIYYTSKYWRAFYYYVKYNKFSVCWPQFGQKELKLILSTLTPDELSIVEQAANKEWMTTYPSNEEISNLFVLIKKPIYNLCLKRAKALFKYDPSLYSINDLIQIAYEEALTRIRNNDYLPKDPNKFTGWILKCIDNALLNLKSKALANKRSFVIASKDQKWTPRLCHISTTTNEDDDVEFNILNSCQLIYNNNNEIHNNLNMKKILEKADPKVTTYFKTIYYGEHNPDFWSWFYYTEPALAERTSYVEENLDAISPYLQQHLNLSTRELIRFCRRYLPSMLNKVKSRSALKQLKVG